MACSAVILSYRRNFDLCEIVATRERPKEKEKEEKQQEHFIYTDRSSIFRFFQHFPSDGRVSNVERSRQPRSINRLQELLMREGRP
jgi:hypothetical protein